MELDYVVVEEEKKDPPKPPEPVKRVTVQAQPEEKTEPTPPQEIIPQDVPLESSDESIDQAQVYVPPIPAPVKKIVSDQPVSIGAVSELDNVDFDPIFNPKPVYPKMALDANIEGYVDAELVVTEDGRVETFSFTRVAGHPSFGTETAKVLSRWRFPPPRIKGEKAKIRYVYRINFKLD
jgi:protein TonB